MQGLLNLIAVSEMTGGNTLSARSHLSFGYYLDHDGSCATFYRTRLEEIAGDDWLEVDPDDTVVLNPTQRLLSLLLRPGDFLLWDSRLAHCSYPPKADVHIDPQSGGDLIRAAALVSMMPSKYADHSVLQARKEAAHQQRTLTHWANQVAQLGAERPDLVGLEKERVKLMKAYKKKILLSWDDLRVVERSLVVGNGFRVDAS